MKTEREFASGKEHIEYICDLCGEPQNNIPWLFWSYDLECNITPPEVKLETRICGACINTLLKYFIKRNYEND